jgi:menaquinone-dependent protoporphyrinogen oxidase
MKTLVAYATKHGSTRQVAVAIADALVDRGLEVGLRPAAEVKDLTGYDAVVLGGALYTGRWHRDARQFLSRHRATLAGIPLAVFGLGPLTLEPKDVEGSRKQLERALARTPELKPALVAVFGGVVSPSQLHFPLSHMHPSDARDWDAIEDWAQLVSEIVRDKPRPLHEVAAVARSPVQTP